jgi:hypothetical protein
MKKIASVISILTLSFVTVLVLATNNEASAQQGATTQMQQRLQVSPSPIGNQVQNQNQIKTQNGGEDSQINANVGEQESLKEASPRSETAIQNMSNVAQQVEDLLTTKTLQGGIGQQVKVIAQEQKTAQDGIQAELGKVDGRNGLLKSIIGPDFRALKNMQKAMEQNQLRIQELTLLQNQLTNQGDITQVKEMIQALIDQNTALQDRVNLEEKSGSLFGWLVKLFVK